jgi:hypothetical protein
MTRALRAGLLGATVLLCSAHVGSPDAWYEGPAGPYRVLVHVQAPPVIPGIAVVNVRPGEPGLTRITAYVNRFDAQGSPPPPDILEPVPDTPGWFRTRLWVMTAGSNGVTVALDGPRGKGAVVVPLAAVAARRLAFSPFLAALLLAVGVILALGLFSIVGAAVRESALPPGAEPDARRRRRARWAVARAVLGVGAVLTVWTLWWRAEDRRFVRNLFRPLAIATRLETGVQPPRLRLTITDSAWIRRNDGAWLRARGLPEQLALIEDHGKLIHLFLIASGGKAAFAHLHPFTSDSVSFETALPPLPEGSYFVFADVVLANGFTETLVATVMLPPNPSRIAGAAAVDLDNSWAVATPTAQGNRAVLEDGTTLTWLRSAEPLRSGSEAGLRFLATAPPGRAAPPELYMGMAGHAAVVRDDGSVFIHLHPLGTISLAAQASLSADPVPGAVNRAPRRPGQIMSHQPVPGDTLYFPYAFPREGDYTVWVQLKRRGRVLTGAFLATVLPASR